MRTSEEIIEKWGNLKLTEAEQIEVNVNCSEVDVIQRHGKFFPCSIRQNNKQKSLKKHNAEHLEVSRVSVVSRGW